MTTKQINDLVSFVAMNAMDGVDNKQAAEWIAAQNLDKEVADHLQNIVANIANNQQYIATIWTCSDNRSISRAVAMNHLMIFVIVCLPATHLTNII